MISWEENFVQLPYKLYNKLKKISFNQTYNKLPSSQLPQDKASQ